MLGSFVAIMTFSLYGYFDYPRRINAEQLAEKMGMHKTTLIEPIHKAEKRLIGHIIS
jgi:predicted DNA binding protein